MQKNKKLLAIGSYSQDYPRNSAIIRILRKNYSVSIVNIKTSGIEKYWHFAKKLFTDGVNFDMVFLIYPSQRFAFIVILYRIFSIILNKKQNIIFDAFISIFDTYISDRKLASKYSAKAIYYFLLDYLSCWAADKIVYDTIENRNFFISQYGIAKKKKNIVFPVSVDLHYLDAIKSNSGLDLWKSKYKIVFYGNYIPLQGVSYIVEAARLLKENSHLQFILIGSGQEKKDIVDLCARYKLNNVHFVDRVDYETLIQYVRISNLCLGIFGKSEKAGRVIPNKILDYLACNKLVLTGRNNSMERYFKDYEDLIYCRRGDAQDLAEKITMIYNGQENYKNVAGKARHKLEKNFSLNSLDKLVKEYL